VFCDRLFDGSRPEFPADSTSLERMMEIRHRAKLSKEMTWQLGKARTST
jgi:hypothetical protein